MAARDAKPHGHQGPRAPLGPDLITVEELDRLNDSELRQLHALLQTARNGGSVEAEFVSVSNGNGNADASAIAAPVAAPPALTALEPPVTKPAPVGGTDRERQMARAEELIALLSNQDPITTVRDPVLRGRLIRELNGLASRFGRPMWQELRWEQ